jgi:PTH1 family peptidyl-tRNA hydrolase
MSPSLLVGLGNPGDRYQDTRHNLGAQAVEFFAARYNITLVKSHQLFMYGAGEVEQHPVAVSIPRTFMNESGRAVSALLAVHPFPIEKMVVVYDDMDLLEGHLRFRREGSDGGHRGVRSLIQALGTNQFWRFKLGIGRPALSGNEADYVLAIAPKKPALDPFWVKVLDALRCFVTEGPEAAMNLYNQPPSEKRTDFLK